MAVSGIDNLYATYQNFTIYTIDGKIVCKNSKSLEGLKGVYIVNGKKTIIK